MRREAAWLGQLLESFPATELDPVLSLGSGTPAFRSAFQPWIETLVYGPLVGRGVTVLHHELEPSDGIDIAGDLGDELVRRQLREAGVRTILCLNVLEHVSDRSGLARALVAAAPPGGLVVVTVPRRFPYHADPIDTLFRPSPAELAALFPGTDVVDAGSVRCESLLAHWLSKPGKVGAIGKAAAAFRRRDPGAAPSGAGDREHPGPSLPSTARMAVESTEVTYVVLRIPA